MPQVKQSYIYAKLLGVPLLDSQHVLPLLALSAEGKEAHASTQFHPILQRTFKLQLQDSTLPILTALQYDFDISSLEKKGKKHKNGRIIFIPPLGRGIKGDVSSAFLQQQRDPQQKTPCAVQPSCGPKGEL